jgi:hypothetical protein
MISKSYLNTYYRELGHLCPSGILRSISLSPTTCLSTWRYHSLFITTSLLVQVGLISLGRLFNTVGTIINPHLELTQSSPYQDTLASSNGIKLLIWYNKAISLYSQEHTISPSHLLTHLSHSHPSIGHLHLLGDSTYLKPLDPSTRHLLGRSKETKQWSPMLDHVHIPSILPKMKALEEVYKPYLMTSRGISLSYYP